MSQNVLAQELGNIKDFFKRYGNWITGLLVAVLIVFLIVWHYRSRGARELAEQRGRYETSRRELSLPEKQQSALNALAELAENAADPVLAASASLDAADFCLGQYVDGLRLSDSGKARDYRNKAEKYYRLVVEKHPGRTAFVARAHFGLGVLAENDADWTTARSEYQQVCRLVNPAFPVATEAQLRLNRLQVWSRPARFATTEPATAPAETQPTSTQATTKPTSTTAATRPASIPAGGP